MLYIASRIIICEIQKGSSLLPLGSRLPFLAHFLKRWTNIAGSACLFFAYKTFLAHKCILRAHVGIHKACHQHGLFIR